MSSAIPSLASSMFRPSFTVATLVLLVLAVIAVISKGLKPYVPLRPANVLAMSEDDFLRQAAHEPVAWHYLSDKPFLVARQERKPILLVIGTPWSSLARKMDDTVFTDVDVARYLNRNFVCVRIDASADRKWLNAYLPYSRATWGLMVGFQAWILDPNGRMMDLIGRNNAAQDINQDTFLAALIDARGLVEKIAGENAELLMPDQAQDADLQQLEGSPRLLLPDFDAYTDSLVDDIDPVYGGFPMAGLQPLQPNAWRYLVLAGRISEARRAVDPVVYSSLNDVLDGGFFRFAMVQDQRLVSFDKCSTNNAEAALSLALLEKMTHDPAYGFFARGAYDCVANTMSDHLGLIATCRTGLEKPNSRSGSHSFGNQVIHRQLSPQQEAWARSHLSLDPVSNPQMVPHYSSSASLGERSAVSESVIDALRRSVAETDPLAGLGSTESHTFSVARLIETARIWNDGPRLAALGPQIEAADALRVGTMVLPKPKARSASDYLGDWLGVADLELQRFLMTGRSQSVERGAAILARALDQFEGRVAGEYYVGSAVPRDHEPQNYRSPEVCDNVHESCTARVIRLCQAYGSLLGPTPQGIEFRRRAYGATDLMSGALADGGPRVAGYYCASLAMRDDVLAVSVGPDAVRDGNSLFQLVPYRLVTPAVGPVRRDLQSRPPGIYIVRLAHVSGPFSVLHAANLLARPLASGGSSAP